MVLLVSFAGGFWWCVLVVGICDGFFFRFLRGVLACIFGV